MKNLFSRTLALVCAILMMISLFALPAFAHEGHDHEGEEEVVEQGLSTAAIVWIVIGGVLVVVALMLGCGVVINLDRKKMLDKNGSFAQIAKNTRN